MADKRFNINITATDKTAAALKQVEKNFGAVTKGTPLEKLVKGFADLQARGRGFRGLASAFGLMGDAARGSAGGVGEAATAAGALAEGLGVVGLVVGGVTAGIGAAGAAGLKFEADYSRAGAAVGFFSTAIGVSAADLQRFQIAGAKAAVSAEAMSAAFEGVGNTLEDALAGRNQAALALMSRLGIQVHRLADGSIDARRAIEDIAGAMQGQNAEARQLIARTFGVAGALNFLIQTQDKREAQLREADRSGAIRSQRQIDDDIRMHQSLSRVDDAWHHLLNSLSTKLIVPWLQPLLDGVNSLIDGANTLAGDGGARVSRSSAGGGVAYPTFGGGGPSGPSNGSAADRRNNPGNLTDPHTGRFRTFGSMSEGFDAMKRQLLVDYNRGQRTVRQIIDDPVHGWSAGNMPGNTPQSSRNYVDRVSRDLGVGADQALDLHDPKTLGRLMTAMNGVERGGPGRAASGAVEVTVNLKGAPPGTTVVASATGDGVRARARISGQMWGGPT